MKNLIKAAAAVLLCCGIAQATTTKFVEWTATSSENPTVDGAATMKYESGRGMTHVTVVMHNLLPNTTYGVGVFSDGMTKMLSPNAISTNNGGNGSFQTDIPSDTTVAPEIVIYIYDGVGDLGELRTAEVRAFACPN